jgi:hypothetical protein
VLVWLLHSALLLDPAVAWCLRGSGLSVVWLKLLGVNPLVLLLAL